MLNNPTSLPPLSSTLATEKENDPPLDSSVDQTVLEDDSDVYAAAKILLGRI